MQLIQVWVSMNHCGQCPVVTDIISTSTVIELFKTCWNVGQDQSKQFEQDQ